MELTYKTTKLKELCENPKFNQELVKKYGQEVAKKLPQRINELKSFNSLGDVPVTPPFKRHKLTGNRNEQFAVNINNQYRLIFRINDNNILIEDLMKIKEIEIMEVSKHYE